MTDADAFTAHRDLLFTVAYELLASAADAEDAVQETWLRWSRVDQAGVENPRAYLVRIATRQALNRLRTVQRRRETYTGPWLPEPLRTAPDVADAVALAERVSMAMLLVLETLPPVERAVFVLREVFDVGYDEIAETVDRTPATVRQIAHRARAHVAARRPRRAAPSEEARRVLASFRAAMETGDLAALLEVLAPDVVLVADGGGVKRAALRPIEGAEKVMRFLLGALGKAGGVVRVEPAVVNGAQALVVHLDGEVDGVLAARIDDGRIAGLYYVRNPQKLSGLDSEAPLAVR